MDVVPEVDLDRAHAILSTIWGAKDNDVVLLAGKGHETYQEFSGQRTAFDDREWAGFELTWLRGELAIPTDSRRMSSGQLFLAIQGDTSDGHDYLPPAIDRGAFQALPAPRNSRDRRAVG